MQALVRARAEFIEMPDLQLTVVQASRLWSLDLETCSEILSRLVEARFLVTSRNATYIRA
ncbi:MAG: hypothetical protein AB7P99_17755 [Vicinamibacterales bacterium]